MHRTLACLGLLAGAVGLAPGESPRLPPRPPAAPGLQEEATVYANQLTALLVRIEQSYVRPVRRADLTYEALKGLYEAARAPVPRGLEDEVRRAAREDRLHRLLVQVRQELGACEPLQGPRGVIVSLSAAARSLDPYTRLVREDNAAHGKEDLHSSYGFTLVEHVPVGPLLVQAVTPGGPAQHAGLRPGDRVTHLDNQPVEGRSLLLNRLTRLIEGQECVLTVARGGSATPVKATLKPRAFKAETVLGVIRRADNSWDFWADREHKIAHVRVAKLEEGTARDLARAVAKLHAEGLRGLILDLRWCPGGLLDESVDAADLFLPAYPVNRFCLPTPTNAFAPWAACPHGHPLLATVKYRNAQEDEWYLKEDGPGLVDFPLVVLVNGESMGGAELIAAALQDNGRARVAGQRTLGKSSVQTPVHLDPYLTRGHPGTLLRLSTGMFLRPSGRNVNRFADSRPGDDWGVRPDPRAEFRVSPELGRQLQEWWTLQSLRPGGSKETLPLDDPAADPQRWASYQLLREASGERLR